MDVHKKSISVAMLLPRRKKPVEWTVTNEPRAIRRMVKKLVREARGEVRCCYEAGPCGYVLKRTIESTGPVVCEVVAPSLVPVKPGDKIKTDRRDAKKLAELLRADLLTEVRPPSLEEEGVRDLCRCREDAKEDLMRARHRLGKLLLRRGLVFGGGKAWTGKHRTWLRSLNWDNDADQAVFDDYIRSIEHIEERQAALTVKLEELSKQPPYAEPVASLRCFRGIDTVTAMTIVAELHDFSRFQSARELMSYLGLVPSEDSSGDRKRKGSITKMGNRHVRKALIEAAWHYRHKPAVGAKLRKRREGQPGDVIAIADRAQLRLNRRYWKLLLGNNKPKNKVVVAVARELVGFIWAVLYPRAAEGARA
jgi:transposase